VEAVDFLRLNFRTEGICNWHRVKKNFVTVACISECIDLPGTPFRLRAVIAQLVK
jgi:hypothetical protein